MKLPTLALDTVFHVGDLSIKRRAADSLEGPGLSVSMHPEEWSEIAGLGGSVYKIERKDGRPWMLIDFRSLSKSTYTSLLRETVASGYLIRKTGATVSWMSVDDGELRSAQFESYTEARADASDREASGDENVTVKKTSVYLATSSLQSWWKKYFSSPLTIDLSEEMGIVRLLHDSSYDGIWWNDRLAVELLSAPRGVIFPSRVKSAVASSVRPEARRKNPSVHRKSPWLMFGNRKMRDAAAAKDFAELSKNVMIVGPFGPIAKIFGIDPDTHILYMFKEEAERDKFYEGVTAGKVTPPIFQMYRPGIFGLGTIDLFLKKKETKKMVAAIQCFTDTSGDKKTLVVTHMVVKPTYRREHINTFLVDYLVHQTGATVIEFDDLTDKGREFMLRYRSDQLGRGKERARFGR